MDIFLGGSRSAGPDTSGASPATLPAVNYLDVQLNGGNYSVDVPAFLVAWGAVSAGSLELRLYEVNEDLTTGALFATMDTPFTAAAEEKHEYQLPAFSGVKTLRLVGVLTDGVDAAVWFLGVVRSEVVDAEDFPVDCAPLQTALCNKALGYIGITDQLTDVQTQAGVNAVMCRLYLAGATRECLRSFPWGFATAYADCAYVDGADDDPVNQDWSYSYRMPSDCLMMRRVIRAGSKRTFDADPPPFRQGQNDGLGRLLFSDYADPNADDPAAPTLPIEYTQDPSCALGLCDELFAEALSWLVAAKLAPSIARNKVTAGDAYGMFKNKISEAKTVAANEQQRQTPNDQDGDASWIRDRA